MMKRIILFFIIVSFVPTIYAQTEHGEKLGIQAAMDACIALRDAAASRDTASIRKSAKALAACGIGEFKLISQKGPQIENSLNGHLVFTDVFADSLAKDFVAYENSESINSSTGILRESALKRDSQYRGQNADGSITSKTFFIKARQTSVYEFPANGYQELGVVTEHGGRVTLKVKAENRKGFSATYDDRDDVKIGRAQRYKYFTMPDSPNCRVVVEIVNCCDKDFSFVVISN